MDEVRLAVEKVYNILEIYEVYEYQVTQYNPETGVVEHFVEYKNTFFEIEGGGGRLSRLCSKPSGRRAVYRVLLEE